MPAESDIRKIRLPYWCGWFVCANTHKDPSKFVVVISGGVLGSLIHNFMTLVIFDQTHSLYINLFMYTYMLYLDFACADAMQIYNAKTNRICSKVKMCTRETT